MHPRYIPKDTQRYTRTHMFCVGGRGGVTARRDSRTDPRRARVRVRVTFKTLCALSLELSRASTETVAAGPLEVKKRSPFEPGTPAHSRCEEEGPHAGTRRHHRVPLFLKSSRPRPSKRPFSKTRRADVFARERRFSKRREMAGNLELAPLSHSLSDRLVVAVAAPPSDELWQVGRFGLVPRRFSLAHQKVSLSLGLSAPKVISVSLRFDG